MSDKKGNQPERIDISKDIAGNYLRTINYLKKQIKGLGYDISYPESKDEDILLTIPEKDKKDLPLFYAFNAEQIKILRSMITEKQIYNEGQRELARKIDQINIDIINGEAKTKDV